MFVGDFNSKLEAFGCASKNTSGPILKTIQNKLNLIYVNSDVKAFEEFMLSILFTLRITSFYL